MIEPIDVHIETVDGKEVNVKADMVALSWNDEQQCCYGGDNDAGLFSIWRNRE